jgi:hypothetical protein
VRDKLTTKLFAIALAGVFVTMLALNALAR